MDSPRYTVIIPVLRFRAEESVLVSLRATSAPAGGFEILVAEGHQPSRQRNAALEKAHGEIIVFLDNDCRIGPDFWKELAAAFDRTEVEIVGGPALLRPEAGSLERIFHALLTHPLVVGTACARYAVRGGFRKAKLVELILCNMAVRRSTFSKIGQLSPLLYPSEENEWLDRARAAGLGIYYDPLIQVFRPQRATWWQMGRMLLRYGMGRTRQFRVSGWHVTFHQVLPLLLLLTILAVAFVHLETEFVALWLTASVVIAVTCDFPLRIWQRIVAGLIAPLIPLVYAVGQCIGWLALPFPTSLSLPEITVFNERGEKLS